MNRRAGARRHHEHHGICRAAIRFDAACRSAICRAALYGIIGILVALRARDATGKGQHVDIAMLDCQVAMLEDALARYSVSRRVPGPIGTRHPSITPFQQFRASDAFFVAGAGNESIWLRMCDAIGRPELKDDSRFAQQRSHRETPRFGKNSRRALCKSYPRLLAGEANARMSHARRSRTWRT